MSSLIDLAIKQLYRYVDQQVGAARAFRATVAGQSSGMVQIKRLHSDSAETQLIARVEGYNLETNDEILCTESAPGFPVVVGALQRAAPTRPGHYRGSGSPEGSVTAPVGSTYQRSDGAAGTTLYSKVSGTGNTGWQAIGADTSPFSSVMRSMAPDADTSGFGVLESLAHGYQDFYDTRGIAFDANSPGCWAVYNTTGVTDNDAGWDCNGSNPMQVRTNWHPARIVYRVQTGANVTTLRIWVGVFSGSPVASSDPAVHGAGFRFDTSAGSVNWWAWSNDGSGGGTLTNTGVTPSSHTAYTLEIEIVSTTELRFYIDGVLVATHTTNLPSATTSLIPHCKVRTLSNAVRSVRWAWFHVRHS